MSTAGVIAGPAINHSNPTVLQQHPSGVLIIEDQAGHLHGVEIDAHGHPVRRHLTPEQEKKASTVRDLLSHPHFHPRRQVEKETSLPRRVHVRKGNQAIPKGHFPLHCHSPSSALSHLSTSLRTRPFRQTRDDVA